MKKIKNYALFLLLFLGVFFTGCEKQNEIENIDMNAVPEKSEEYFANLRAYKRSAHTLAFGWFGGWTASGPSMRSRLDTAPDSMDIISVWGNTYNLTEEKLADMRFVQKVKGTKVIFAIFCHDISNVIPEEILPGKPENIPAFANALADSVYKYGYDGIDLDYEVSSSSQLFYNKANMLTLLQELNKYMGPQSGTGKIITVDGKITSLTSAMVPYVDYVIGQNYNITKYTDLQSEHTSMVNMGFRSDQHIITANFESHVKTGGLTYTNDDGTKTQGLLAMAMWNPTQGVKGGFGSYHMEYDYNNPVDYQFMREAINAANPPVE